MGEHLLLDVEDIIFCNLYGWVNSKVEYDLVLMAMSILQDLFSIGNFLSPWKISCVRLEEEVTLEGLIELFFNPPKFERVKMMASEYVEMVSTC